MIAIATKEIIEKATKWFQDGDKQTRSELKMYIFSLDMPYCQKCTMWEKIVSKTLNSKNWKPEEEVKTILI
jgi:hypothetical protein